MKQLFLIFVCCFSAIAVQSPYIISATAKNDSSVTITFRNNDVSTEGFIFLAKAAGATAYSVMDTLTTVTATSFVCAGLLDTTIYYFKMMAYAGGVASDSSNAVLATTFKKVVVPEVKPTVNSSYSPTSGTSTTGIVVLNVYDRSKIESGYALFVSENRGPYVKKTFLKNPTSDTTGYFYLLDTVKANAWYSYKVAACYISHDTMWSDSTAFIYTAEYNAGTVELLVKFQKVSEYPIYLNETGLTAVSGDTVILKETNAPTGLYSLINVSNPQSPAFSGYIDSVSLSVFPINSLIPLFFKFKTINRYRQKNIELFGKYVIVSNGRLYEISGNSIVLKDSVGLSSYIIPSFGDSVYSIFAPFIANNTIPVMPYNYSLTYAYMVRVSGGKLYSSSRENIHRYGVVTVPIENTTTSYWVNYLGFFRGKHTYGGYATGHYSEPDTLPGTNYSKSLAGQFMYLKNTSQLITPFITLFNQGNTFYGIDTRDLNTINTCIDSNLVFHDSHSADADSLRNVIVDTLSKRVYLFYKNYLSILTYSYVYLNQQPTSISRKNIPAQSPSFKCVMSKSTIHISGSNQPFSATIYDVSGRMIGKVSHLSSAPLSWKVNFMANTLHFVRIESKGIVQTFKIMSIK